LNFVHGVGRLADGTSTAEAVRELNAIARRLQTQFPVENARKRGIRFVPALDGIVGPFRTALLTIFASVAAVLLIACANLANLMLTRGASRRKDWAVRLALGASRTAVVRSVLIEALVVALAGGALGILFTRWGVAALVALAPAQLPRASGIEVDVPVLLFSLAVSSFTGLLFGVAPAWSAGRVDVRAALQSSGRGATGHARTRGVLVSTEVAVAVALLVTMAMLAKSFAHVQAVAPGFEAAHALTARLTLPAQRFATPDAIITFQRTLQDRLARLPGGDRVGAISILPLSGSLARVPFTVEGRPIERERVPLAQFRMISPGYFDAAGIPVTRGRSFSDADTASTRPVAIVSQALADRWLAGKDPIGARLLIDDNNTGPRAVDIVGVVGNVQQVALDEPATWDLYIAYAQIHRDSVGLAAGNMFWVVHTPGDPANLEAAIAREVRRLDPDVVASPIVPASWYLDGAVAPRRFSLAMVVIFAAAALALAVTGIYAVVAYGVSQRARELAIRQALGATRAAILRLIVGQGATFVAVGLAAGLAIASGTTRLIGALLFGVAASDVVTFGQVAALVAAISLAACAVPAMRVGPLAARVFSGD
jgi:putative ABC transport system permease protein